MRLGARSSGSETVPLRSTFHFVGTFDGTYQSAILKMTCWCGLNGIVRSPPAFKALQINSSQGFFLAVPAVATHGPSNALRHCVVRGYQKRPR